MTPWLLNPVPGINVSQAYGANPAYYAKWGLPGHEGVDWYANVGTPVQAMADGVVYVVERRPDVHNYGLHVRLKHAHEGVEWQTIYAHLSKVPLWVKPGAPVNAGDLLGYSGNTGNVRGNGHLHVTVKRNGQIVDPTDLIIGGVA